MSRTFKDRPYWVLKNDPKMARYAVHNHLVPHRKEVGEEQYNIFSWRKDSHDLTPIYRTRKLYKRWSEYVPCTLDIPETKDYDEDKHCEYYLEYYPNVHSNKSAKHMVNKSTRGKVRQQCKELVGKYDRVIDFREQLLDGDRFTLEDMWNYYSIDADNWDVYVEYDRWKNYWIWYD